MSFLNWIFGRSKDASAEEKGIAEHMEYLTPRDSVFRGPSAHHLFGYPSPIQDNDMDLQCQLASNGVYCGDDAGHEDERKKGLEAGRTDWTLLLQLDSDDETRMRWGDCGMLYFWIRKDDLKAGRFENCWMVLQCSWGRQRQSGTQHLSHVMTENDIGRIIVDSLPAAGYCP